MMNKVQSEANNKSYRGSQFCTEPDLLFPSGGKLENFSREKIKVNETWNVVDGALFVINHLFCPSNINSVWSIEVMAKKIWRENSDSACAISNTSMGD